MLVTHDMLKKSTPVCIAFNHMPWHYLAVARLDIGGQRKHFIWKTNLKKRFEWDGSFNAQTGEMLRITLNMLHDAGYLGLPESWKPGDEDDGQPPALVRAETGSRAAPDGDCGAGPAADCKNGDLHIFTGK